MAANSGQGSRVRRGQARSNARKPQIDPPAVPGGADNFPRLRDYREFFSALKDLRLRLEVVAAAAAVTSFALKFQNADADSDAALTLQRCVCDGLTDQIEQLDQLIEHAGRRANV